MDKKLIRQNDGTITDEHGNVQKKFEDFKVSETADEVQVDSTASSGEVARAAVMQNEAWALGADLNIKDGWYKVEGDEEYSVFAHREGGMMVGMYLHVEPWAIPIFQGELDVYKKQWGDAAGDMTSYSGPKRHVTGWIAARLNMDYDVHPMKDPKEFDYVLAHVHPDCFIDPKWAKEAKAVKCSIKI